MYSINEIFLSIQGEGINTGRRAIFIRFSGCNLSCDFCDTKYHKDFTLYPLEKLMEVLTTLIRSTDVDYIVLTGGEPMLQKGLDLLIDKLLYVFSERNLLIGIETNGSLSVECLFDKMKHISLTVSPKVDDGSIHCLHPSVYMSIDGLMNRWYESTIKMLFPFYLQHGNEYNDLGFRYKYVQPIYTGEDIDYSMILSSLSMYDNKWRLSVQAHKLIDVK